jgi:prepilin-type processing-associated H-X9-DG protein
MYAEANKDFIPVYKRFVDVGPGGTFVTASHRPAWFNYLHTVLPHKGPNFIAGITPTAEELARTQEIYAHEGVYICPTSIILANPDPGTGWIGYTTYGMNAEISQDRTEPKGQYFKFSQIRKASEGFLLADGDVRDTQTFWRIIYTPLDPQSPPTEMGYPHGGKSNPREGRANVLHFDGHVESYGWQDIPSDADRIAGSARWYHWWQPWISDHRL